MLPIDINNSQKDPDALLVDFYKAEDPSQTKEHHQAILDAAKTNILKVQQRQKEQAKLQAMSLCQTPHQR